MCTKLATCFRAAVFYELCAYIILLYSNSILLYSNTIPVPGYMEACDAPGARVSFFLAATFTTRTKEGITRDVKKAP